MPFAISEDIGDEDFDPLFSIQCGAFSNLPAIRAQYPGYLSEHARAENITRFMNLLGFEDSNVRAAKVIDAETGEICAFATLRFYDESPFVNVGNGDVHFPQVDKGIREAVEWTANARIDRRREFKDLQTPGSYCHLQALATKPSRRRQGAATLLVKWALRISQERRSRAIVESSKDAADYGLYQKQGFRVIDTYHYVDEQRFPGFEGMYLVTMVRDAKEGEEDKTC